MSTPFPLTLSASLPPDTLAAVYSILSLLLVVQGLFPPLPEPSLFPPRKVSHVPRSLRSGLSGALPLERHDPNAAIRRRSLETTWLREPFIRRAAGSAFGRMSPYSLGGTRTQGSEKAW